MRCWNVHRQIPKQCDRALTSLWLVALLCCIVGPVNVRKHVYLHKQTARYGNAALCLIGSLSWHPIPQRADKLTMLCNHVRGKHTEASSSLSPLVLHPHRTFSSPAHWVDTEKHWSHLFQFTKAWNSLFGWAGKESSPSCETTKSLAVLKRLS